MKSSSSSSKSSSSSSSSASCIEKFLLSNSRPWFINFLFNTFEKMIPDSTWVVDFHNLPGIWLYIAAFIFNFMWWSIFLYFIYTSYMSGITDSFISLDSSSGNCKEVPFTLTGTYLIDKSGNWNNDPKYDDSSALYSIEFLSYKSTISQYQKMITDEIASPFSTIGEIGKYRDLAWNLIALSSLTVINTDHGRLQLNSIVDIGTMYNKLYTLGGVAGSSLDITQGSCHPDLNYDSIKAEISLSFNYLNATNKCQEYSRIMGFNPLYDDEFTLSIPLISHTTAIAVNYGIITPMNLIEIKDDPNHGYSYDDDETAATSTTTTNTALPGAEMRKKMKEMNNKKYSTRGVNSHESSATSATATKTSSTATGTTTTWHHYYDSKYLSMTPISCLLIENIPSNATCFLRYSLEDDTFVYAYPISRHYLGTNCSDTSQWTNEWYTTDPTVNGEWVDTEDHSINILLGLVIFPLEADAISFGKEVFYDRMSQPHGDLLSPNSLYDSMRAIIDANLGTHHYSQSDVCGRDPDSGNNRTCFMVVFNRFGSDYFINLHNYQLFAGACRNSLYSSLVFQSIALTPPSPLIERYYECTMRPYDAFFNALGLSLGNSDIYTRWIFFIFMFFFIIFLDQFYETKILKSLGEYQTNLQTEKEEERGGAAGSGGETEMTTTREEEEEGGEGGGKTREKRVMRNKLLYK